MVSRASRRRVLTTSDDNDAVGSEKVQEDSLKSQKRGKGKLKSVKDGKLSTSRSAKATDLSPSPQKSESPRKGASTNGPDSSVNKPIYSFFNAVTQRRQASQPSTGLEKPSGTTNQSVEIIDDNSEDERSRKDVSGTTLSTGSSTALAMRKRKFQPAQGLEDEASLPAPAASQKFRKAGAGNRVPSFAVQNEDKRPWTDQFAPKDLSELAVHKRKVADVRGWLEMMYRGRRQKVLVLKGAAGTGKTVTIQLLAKDLGIELVEWKDQTTSDHAADGFISTSTRFEDFVARAGRSASLVFSTDSNNNETNKSDHHSSEATSEYADRRQGLLIEEFPNTFSKTSSTLQSFRSTIAQYLSSYVPSNCSPTPVIMIISETLLSTNTAVADSFTAHRLLGPELLASPYVNVIDFNTVASTYLTKALEMIVVKEARKSGRRRTPGPQVLKRLAETGDIRSAVSSLEFLCLRGDDGDIWSSKVAFTKPKQSKTQIPLTKAEEEALKLISNRESSLGIFHAVGKVVYNKRREPSRAEDLVHPPPWLPQNRRSRIPETDVGSLIDELGTDTSTFLAALHENYALSCSSASPEQSLESLSGCSNNLSDSDLLSLDRFSFGTRAFSGSTTDSLRQDEMCFQVAVRGLLFNLPDPVHRSAAANGHRGEAHRMFYPASLRLWKQKEEIEGKLETVISQLSSGGSPASLYQNITGTTTASSGGVENWKGSSSFQPATETSTTDGQFNARIGAELKKDMLMDRLPYLAHIWDSQKAAKASQSLHDQIIAVTRVAGSASHENDEDDAEEHDEAVNAAEQWATDGPEVDPEVVAMSPKKRKVPGHKPQAVFQTMSIPVETRVEKLILEDDDIVDD